MSIPHLHNAEVRTKISVSNTGNPKLIEATKRVHAKRIANGEDAIVRAKIRTTMIAKGRWSDEPETIKQAYNKAVRQITRKQPVHLLSNASKRGRGSGAFHLDHIVSMQTGLYHGLPPELVGDISNLRFIPLGENCSKQGRNEIEQVISLFYSNFIELPH